MTAYTDDDVTAVRQVVVEYGGERDESIHKSWRCFDKDRYPEPCDCLDEFSRDVLAAVAPAIAARERVAIAARTAEAVASHVEHLKLGVPDDSPTGDAECRAYDHAAAYIREHLARAEQVNP